MANEVLSIMKAIEEFESQNQNLDSLKFLKAAHEYAQKIWPHRAFDITSDNCQNANIFVRAVLVRKCKNAGRDILEASTKMQTGLRKALNHEFGSYLALTLIEKILFEIEMNENVQ